MNYLNFTKAFASLAIVSVLFTSCDKKEQIDPIGDRGQTIVKILNGGTPGEKSFAIDFVPTPTTIVAADIRRDVPNNAELMKPMTVTIQDDTAAVTAAGFAHLDPAWYTISGNGVTKVGGQGGTYTVTFAPGEFAKQINIIITDATVLNPSLTYGLGFRILSSTEGKVTVNNTLVIVIGAKNKYDGVYQMKGVHNRVPYNFPYDTEMHMITTGASSVIFYWPDAGSIGHPIGVGPNNDLSWYGPAIAPHIVFNAANDLVADVFNNAGLATPISIYTGAGSGQGRYDAATKTIYVYWRYNANDLRAFMDTLVYTGPR